MRSLRVLLYLLSAPLCSPCGAQEPSAQVEPSALVMVHFGTTYDDTRAKTIDAINNKVRASLPQMDFAEEWKAELERQGFTVTVALEGLGEIPEIQDLYIEKLK